VGGGGGGFLKFVKAFQFSFILVGFNDNYSKKNPLAFLFFAVIGILISCEERDERVFLNRIKPFSLCSLRLSHKDLDFSK